MKYYKLIQFLFILLLFSISSCLNQAEITEKSISQVMLNQEICWNNGNIDCFMEGYWNSDSLMFIGKNGINYGWQKTLENYKNSYPSSDEMGKLKFQIIKLETNEENAFMIGKWNIKRDSGDIGGHFTLLWKRIDKEWKIVSDHTS